MEKDIVHMLMMEFSMKNITSSKGGEISWWLIVCQEDISECIVI